MEIVRKKNILTLRVEGDFDLQQCPIMREKIFYAIDEQGVNRVIFDLEGVDFLDSSALGLILTVYKNTAPLGGDVKVTNVKSTLYQYFQMAGLDKIIGISLRKEVRHG